MLNFFKTQQFNKNRLYNNILFLSRKKIIYTKFMVKDTFQNRVNLMFMHFSFIITSVQKNNLHFDYKEYYQKLFDSIFKNIEINMRELGFGDTVVNKKMKFLVKVFYSILKYSENYRNESIQSKSQFFCKNLEFNKPLKSKNNDELIHYFDKFHSFCFDLTPDSVLKGNLNFTYK